MPANLLPAPIEPELLMLAYRSGIFPMADRRDDPEIFWIEPRQRAILPLDGFHLSRSLARTLRRGRFAVTCNAAFSEVMNACAAPRATEDGQSWISHRIQRSYEQLNALGLAHSIECWQTGADGDRQLVGGLYGVGFDGVFCGELMFSRVPDASKIALAWLVAALRRGRAALLDCQFLTPHLASLGAVEMPQQRYLALLQAARPGWRARPRAVRSALPKRRATAWRMARAPARSRCPRLSPRCWKTRRPPGSLPHPDTSSRSP